MSNEAEELCNQGLELMTQHKWAEAEEKMVKAIGHDWESPELRYNLGKCLFHQDKYSRARDSLAKAIELKPDYAEAHALLGSCYYALLDMDSAYSSFLYAIGHFQQARSPTARRECATARAHTILAQGDYLAGFAFYTERLAEPDTWNGTQSLVWKTLLVKAEGGLGDQIFFLRYKAMLNNIGATHVIWEVDEPLVSYFISWGLDDVVKRGSSVRHDYMVHAGSLPYIFGTKLGTIPTFDIADCDVGTPTYIGIACSGNPLHPDDHHRSIPLVEFKPLTELLDKEFYSAQQHLRESDKKAYTYPYNALETYETVEDLGNFLNKLDLVITVDTMTAHLAGAEGIPTWLLLPYAPDWRWGLEGEKTPWYPCMRIFRQGADREWGPVIQRVVEELKNA